MQLIDTGITLLRCAIAPQPCDADMADEDDLEHPFPTGLGNMPCALVRSQGDADIGFCNDRFQVMCVFPATLDRSVKR